MREGKIGKNETIYAYERNYLSLFFLFYQEKKTESMANCGKHSTFVGNYLGGCIKRNKNTETQKHGVLLFPGFSKLILRASVSLCSTILVMTRFA